MNLNDFNYTYPKELVAQRPLRRRSTSKMMVIYCQEKTFMHSKFSHLPHFLNSGDVLVLNESRVIPARLFGRNHNGRRFEILLLAPVHIDNICSNTWKCLAKKSKLLTVGDELIFAPKFKGRVLNKCEENIEIEFTAPRNLIEELEKYGLPPLPPYIKRKGSKYRRQDKQRYQTIYAKDYGSVAAPTAGLHFSRKLLSEISAKGVHIATISLHISADTFKPVKTNNITDHKMHGESYRIPTESAKMINMAKKEGRRVIAVGTTTTRALESAAINGMIKSTSSCTTLFIYPGYKFQIIDGLITNFHQPKSTLLMMVSAFAGRKFILKMYQEAIKNKYRLFSYGDCMLLLKRKGFY